MEGWRGVSSTRGDCRRCVMSPLPSPPCARRVKVEGGVIPIPSARAVRQPPPSFGREGEFCFRTCTTPAKKSFGELVRCTCAVWAWAAARSSHCVARWLWAKSLG
eukprot:scaffold12803_cov60-Isochrysis_galbana.AAC.1